LNPDGGDGIVSPEAGEECDYGEMNAPPESVPYGGCTTGCKREAHCGDGHLDSFPLEMCDDGNSLIRDGCNDNCLEEIRL
jgi:cysteine-rich repeat protein